jgi:hypothetical protein
MGSLANSYPQLNYTFYIMKAAVGGQLPTQSEMSSEVGLIQKPASQEKREFEQSSSGAKESG